MAVLSFDELNKLYDGKYKRKSMPYEQYFGEMDLTDKQRKERINFAEKFEEVMMFLFFLLLTFEEYGSVEESQDFILQQVKQRYRDLVIDYVALDEYIEEYIDNFSEEVIKTTNNHSDDPYYKSEDRAKLIAENEANSVLNYSDFIKAMDKGFTKKKWKTELDIKVRHTHRPMEGKIIDINIPFVVGESLMMFPKDTTYGADAEEIVNCRCTIEYIK